MLCWQAGGCLLGGNHGLVMSSFPLALALTLHCVASASASALGCLVTGQLEQVVVTITDQTSSDGAHWVRACAGQARCTAAECGEGTLGVYSHDVAMLGVAPMPHPHCRYDEEALGALYAGREDDEDEEDGGDEGGEGAGGGEGGEDEGDGGQAPGGQVRQRRRRRRGARGGVMQAGEMAGGKRPLAREAVDMRDPDPAPARYRPPPLSTMRPGQAALPLPPGTI